MFKKLIKKVEWVWENIKEWVSWAKKSIHNTKVAIVETTQDNFSEIGKNVKFSAWSFWMIVDWGEDLMSLNIFKNMRWAFKVAVWATCLVVSVPSTVIGSLRLTLWLPYDIITKMRELPKYESMISDIQSGISLLEKTDISETGLNNEQILLLKKNVDSICLNFNACLDKWWLERNELQISSSKRRFFEFSQSIKDELNNKNPDSTWLLWMFVMTLELFEWENIE